jgi:putative hydroxymethylpyrimidine transport system ATP-binding protein
MMAPTMAANSRAGNGCLDKRPAPEQAGAPGETDVTEANDNRPPAVTVKDARLEFAADVLFENLSVTLEAGRLTCLLGPSGVGKSSLLRLIAGLAPAGEDGQVLCDDGLPAPGRIAYMAQSDLLLPWLGALDNVLLGSRLRGAPPDRARARSLLADLGLAGYETARPTALSGGMRQRVALARTLMEDRPIVLMDEPFSALDAITRARLQDLAIPALRGRTVLLVTHDPLEAIRIADRIEIMAGRPARLGETLIPPGTPPRDAAAPEMAALYGDLMTRLTAADAT